MSTTSINGNPQDETTLEAALNYVSMGLKIVPIPLGMKGPNRKGWNAAGGWFSTPEQVREHWAATPTDGIGVVLGPSRLVSLDIDCWDEAAALLAEKGLSLHELVKQGWATRGLEDRARILFRLPENGPTDLARKVVESECANPQVIYELRAGAVCDILPPTIHPETGRPYRTIGAVPKRFIEIAEVPDGLLALFIEHRNQLWARQEGGKKTRSWRKKYPREFEYANGLVSTLLEQMGAEQVSEHVYTCPFHRPDIHPSFLRYEDDGVHLMFDTHGGEVGRPTRQGWAFLDAFDLYQQAHDLGSLQAALQHIQQALGVQPDEGEGKQAQTYNLLRQNGLKLLRTVDAVAYAELPSGPGLKLFRVEGRPFMRAVRSLVFQQTATIPPKASIEELCDFLSGEALNEGEEVEVFGRYGEQDGVQCIALSNSLFVQITPGGWQITETVPLRMWLPSRARALPIPQPGGQIEALQELFHLSRPDLIKVVTFTLAAMKPGRTMRYPILAISGEQGSAKTSLTRFLKLLIDPAGTSGRTLRSNEKELAVASANDHLLCFDNVSRVPPAISDALCRMSTGGEFAGRTLYTDGEESVIHAHCPVILNGIPELAERGDLADRTYAVYLTRIPEHQRLTEEELDGRVQELLPLLLGLFCDGLAAAMNNQEAVPASGLPRLADAARLGMTAAQAFGFEPAEVLEVLKVNSAELNGSVLDSSPFGVALVNFIRREGTFTGSVSELKRAIIAGVESLSADWPQSPLAVSNELRRLAPALRTIGIAVVWLPRTNSSRRVQLSLQPEAENSPED